MHKEIDIHTAARYIAIGLTMATGELWTARIIADDTLRAHVDSPTATLFISQAWNSDRLTIQADAPEGIRELTRGEHITVNPDRPPLKIAQDINNRLLAHARAHLVESRAYDLKERKKEAREKLTNNMIKKYLPKEYQKGKFCTETDRHAWKERIYAERTYDELIHIEFNLKLPEALKLLKQLTQGEN